MIGNSLRYSKVIEYPIKDSPLLIDGGYTLGHLIEIVTRNLWLEYSCLEEEFSMACFVSNGSRRQDKYTWASSSSGSRCIVYALNQVGYNMECKGSIA